MTKDEFVRMIAHFQTFEELCRDRLEAEGVTEPKEIANELDASQSDLDYLCDCEETMKSLILEARAIVASQEVQS